MGCFSSSQTRSNRKDLSAFLSRRCHLCHDNGMTWKCRASMMTMMSYFGLRLQSRSEKTPTLRTFISLVYKRTTLKPHAGTVSLPNVSSSSIGQSVRRRDAKDAAKTLDRVDAAQPHRLHDLSHTDWTSRQHPPYPPSLDTSSFLQSLIYEGDRDSKPE